MCSPRARAANEELYRELLARRRSAKNDAASGRYPIFLLEALRAATDYRQFAVTMRQMRRDRSGK